MAKYTCVLLDYMRSLSPYGLQYGHTRDIIESARQKIFNFDYPIHDETYRKQLETKILRHYAFWEIGQETPDMWLFYLETKMNEIMSLYSELLKTTTLQFNPLYTMDVNKKYTVKTTGDTTTEGNSKSEGNNTTNNINKFSDTPQSTIADIESYLTNANVNDVKMEDTSINLSVQKSDINNLTEYTELVQGKSDGNSYSTLLKEYRETLQNYDMEIIKSLNGLFMQIF